MKVTALLVFLEATLKTHGDMEVTMSLDFVSNKRPVRRAIVEQGHHCHMEFYAEVRQPETDKKNLVLNP